MHPIWKVGAFIDVQNVYMPYAQQGKRVNYEALRNFLHQFYCADCKEMDIRHITENASQDRLQASAILYPHAFIPYSRENEGQKKFILALAQMGYRVITKPVRVMPDGSKKVNLDIEITLHIVSQASHYDEIVLISGDGELTPVVNYLIFNGKKVTVIGPEGATAPELMKTSHRFFYLSEIPHIFDPWTPPRADNGASGVSVDPDIEDYI